MFYHAVNIHSDKKQKAVVLNSLLVKVYIRRFGMAVYSVFSART